MWRQPILCRWSAKTRKAVNAASGTSRSAYANINAKAEEIESKRAFRAAFERRRCLVPVDNFYERQKTAAGKQSYAIALADRGLMALAGLWELAVADGREAAQLRDHHHDPERAVRRAARPDASDPRARGLAGMARTVGGGAATQGAAGTLPF